MAEHISTSIYIEDQINSFCIVGVNLFVLISGWFGIKKKTITHFGKIIYICFICALVFKITDPIQKFQFFTILTECWFIPHYLFLVLISPILEKALLYSSIKEQMVIVCYLFIANVVIGYFLAVVNSDGYNVLNFVFLYFTGRLLRNIKEKDHGYLNGKIYYWLLAYFICSILIGAIHSSLHFHGIYIPAVRYWSYNNPLILLSSFILFVFFANLEAGYNTIINTLSKGVIYTYLLPSSYFISSIINRYAIIAYGCLGYIGFLMYSIFIFLFILIVGSVISSVSFKIGESFLKVFVLLKNKTKII